MKASVKNLIPILIIQMYETSNFTNLVTLDQIQLTKVFTYFLCIDAILGTFTPISSIEKIIGISIKKGSLDEYFAEARGLHAASLAMTNYLVLSGMSIEESIGYGILFRFPLVLRIVLTHVSVIKKVNPIVVLSLDGIIFGSGYNLIYGNFNKDICESISAIAMIFYSSLFFSAPRFCLRRIWYMKSGEDGKDTIFLLRLASLYLLLGGLQIHFLTLSSKI